MKQTMVGILGIFLMITALSSCKTAPEVIPDDLSVNEYFQLAHTAYSNRGNDVAAIAYYTTFIERYPENLPKVVEAEYEMAIVYFKEKEYERSMELFNTILEKYSDPDMALMLPQWPLKLTEKKIAEYEEMMAEDEPEEETEE